PVHRHRGVHDYLAHGTLLTLMSQLRALALIRSRGEPPAPHPASAPQELGLRPMPDRNGPHGHRWGRVRRLAAPLTLVGLLALSPAALAQREAFDQMRNLLQTGYYNSAARLNGPDLIARFPEDAEARYLYARALYLTGDIAGARSQLDRAMALASGE